MKINQKNTLSYYALGFAVIMLFCLFPLGCSDKQSDNKKPEYKTYKHSMSGTPNSLDPVKASSKYANTVILAIFDTLYSYKYLARPYEIKPNLAESLPAVSDNGMTYIIRIKPGNYFNNHPTFKSGVGREVIAEDFIYSMKRVFDPMLNSSGKWLWRDYVLGLQEWAESGADYDQKVDGLIALDRYTIQIKLTKPYPQLMHTLTMGYAAIVPQESVEFYGPEFSVNPVGSGPYILKTFDSQVARFEKNKSYRKEFVDLEYEGYNPLKHDGYGLSEIDRKSPPFIDKLEIHFITEKMSKWLSFNKDNEIQYTTVPPRLSNQVLDSNSPIKIKNELRKKYNHTFSSELGFAYFGFNMAHKNFGYSSDLELNKRNKYLRCAIRTAHDWSQRNEAFYFGIGNVFPGVIVPGTFDYESNFSKDSIIYDLQKAKRMLKEGGWNSDNLPVFEYHAVGNVEHQRIFEQTRGFLKQLGYPNDKVKFEQHINFGVLNKSVEDGEAPFFFMSWNMDYPDAQNTLQMFYGPNKAPGSNKFSFNNDEYNMLYEQSLIMSDSIERKKIFSRLNQIVVDECAIISGINRTFISLWHKDVIFYPTEDITGAGFLKYVALKKASE